MSEENLTDEEILAKLNLTADGELPGDDEPPAGESADDREKRIRHAFAEKKRATKQALALAEKLKKENEELKKAGTPPPPPQPKPNDGDQRAKGILTQLTIRAMQNLGIETVTESNQELVRMERDRLYMTLANQAESRRDVEGNAGAVVDNALAEMPGLDDRGVAEVKKRLNSLDVLERVKPATIRRAVSEYLGEQVLAGTFVPPTNGDDAGSGDGDEGDLTGEALRGRQAATATAASAVKSGRTGVRPGKSSSSDGEPAPKPDELAEMRKFGFTDLKAYRAAKARKSNYLGH